MVGGWTNVDLVQQQNSFTTTDGIYKIGLGHVHGPRLAFIRTLSEVRICDVETNMLDTSVPWYELCGEKGSTSFQPDIRSMESMSKWI